MDKPNEQILLDNIGKIAFTMDKAYIPQLSSKYGVLYFDEKYNKDDAICYENNIRAVKIDRWVFDKEEKPGESFKNVLSTFADGDHSIALVVKRTPSSTEMYFVVKNEGAGRNEDSRGNVNLLKSSIMGNFQGSHCEIVDDIELMERLFSFSEEIEIDDRQCDAVSSIALLTNTPSEYSENYIGQGLDKVLNGIVPETEEESYTIVFLAESLLLSDIRDIISGYEEMATAIAPFLQYQFQAGTSETKTQGEMESVSDTEGISNSVFKTHSINIGANGSISSSRSNSLSDAVSTAIGAGLSKVASRGLSFVLGAVGGCVAGPAGAAFGAALGDAAGSLAPNLTRSNTQTQASTESSGGNLGLSAGYGYSWGKSKTITSNKTKTKGTNSSISVGTSENTTYTYKSYMVADLLSKIEQTIDRMNKSQATGLWKYATYVLAGDSKTTKNVANYLRGITQGKESFNEPAFVQEWSKQGGHKATAFGEIRKYISYFTHPIFVAADNEDGNAMMLTATSYVATDELAHVMVFPRKSLQGISVIGGVEFGREPHSLICTDTDLEIGNGYHMYQEVSQQRIKISKEELTKHTFIAGSTGSGKSNTICKLLETLNNQGIKFLVIEPAKGEYKTLFGNHENVCVYGTNPNLRNCAMLRMNPFRFPRSVHVLEHLDRLVEIFNVCWPMYAAMPAILKDAMEKAYIAAGWDLALSRNRFDENLYPSFIDVFKQIKRVLDESDYSADNKGDYTGALVTRIKSLTNGLNGLIFTTDDLEDRELFEQNTIVDLSRVGSADTKALIMGILVLKLQEYRMDTGESNSCLKHITVLEEAHNLLKRTSAEQITEGANLLGKSVEMLANAIAEMRTYGEGFVIADQAPCLLDMSAIRNTNTKIILRLPDFADRELVGKAAGLNDHQITELGRLEKGVAAIMQSDWIEPVLCKIDMFDKKCEWRSDGRIEPKERIDENVEESLLECIMNREIYRKGDRTDMQRLRSQVICSRLESTVKCEFLDYINSQNEESIDKLRQFVFDFFHASEAMERSRKYHDINEWVRAVVDHLEPCVRGYSNSQINLLLALIVNEQAIRDVDYTDVFCRFTEIYQQEKRVF